MVIKTAKDRRVWSILRGETPKRFPAALARAAQRRLIALDSATRLEDLLAPPSNRLERLSGDRKGWYSIRINRQWRICFRWTGNDAKDVEIVDYH